MLKQLVRSVSSTAFDRMRRPRVPDEPAWVTGVDEQMSREFVAAPPFTLHLPAPELFAGAWAVFRESVLAGPTDRVQREAVAAGVSTLNDCPYCVDVHTSMVSAGGARDAPEGIRAHDPDAIERGDLRELVRWAMTTRTPGDDVLADPPFPAADRPYIVGTALTFHYVNRMVSTFLKPSPMPVPRFLRGSRILTRVSAAMLGRAVGLRSLVPGEANGLQREASCPEELGCLGDAAEVRSAWGGFVDAADRAGEQVLDAEAREAVGARIDDWTGADMPLGRRWLEDAVEPLADRSRPGARLALLVALAPFRVGDDDVAAARTDHGGDAELVSIAAWASIEATRRIASWL